MKYNSLKEVLQAQKSGELTEPLILDNDSCTVYVPIGDDDEEEEEECVYHGPGYEIREEALTLLGIKWVGA